MNDTGKTKRRPLFWIGIVAALLFVGCRGVGMLLPFPWAVALPVGFLLMMAMPFVFGTRLQRQEMGFAGCKKPSAYILGIALGGGMALVCFGLGWLIFRDGADNWFVSVRDYYLANPSAKNVGKWGAFLIFTIPALIFSPLGEEIFFRGFLHEALKEKLSTRASGWVDSAIFGAAHLFHHGITRNSAGDIEVHPLSGAMWMILMTCAALVWVRLRSRTGSLYPVIVSHAAFNLIMNATIFLFLWPE